MGMSNHPSPSKDSQENNYIENEKMGLTGLAPPIFKKNESEEFKDLYDVKKILCGLQRHLPLIVVCMAVMGALGSYLSYTFQTTYVAEATVIYQAETDTSKNIEGGYTVTNLSLPTVLEIIKQQNHYEAVKTSLGLDLEPEQIGSMVEVPKPKNDSNLIRIDVRAKNPNLAVDIVNALALASVKSSEEFTRKQLKSALNSYQTQLSVVRRTLASQIQDIEDFKVQNQYFDMTPENSSLMAQVNEGRRLRDTALLQYNSYLIQYENLKKELEILPKLVPMTLGAKDSPLQQRISTLETSLSEARAKYAKDNPKILILENEMKDILSQSSAHAASPVESKFFETNKMREKLEMDLVQLQGKVRSALQIKEDLSRSINELEKKLVLLPVQQMSFVKLLQSKDVTGEQIKLMNKAVENALVLINAPKGSIDIYHLATEAKPWKEGLITDLLPIISLLLGLGMGCTLAFLLEIADSKVRTAKQVEMLYSIPCVATIPELSGLNKKNTEKNMLFFIRSLADSVDKSLANKGIHGHATVAIMSSLSKEGKSLIATQLANYYPHLGKKVLLMEMDYHPNLLVEKTQTATGTLAQYLKGECRIENIVTKGSPDVIRVTEKEPNMKELLKSRTMNDLWKNLRAQYDLIIIDTPGLIEDDYAIKLVETADVAFLVVGSSTTSKSTIDETLQLLESAEVRPSGIILNRVHAVYVNDKRILLETKRSKREMYREMFSWKK